MSWERISEVTLGDALVATMRLEREGLRVYAEDRSAITPEQVVQLGEGGFVFVVPYLRSMVADATGPKVVPGTIDRTDYYAVLAALPVTDGSDTVFRQYLDGMRAHLEPARSLGLGIHRVKHSNLQMPSDIQKLPSELGGEFHFVRAAIAITNRYIVRNC